MVADQSEPVVTMVFPYGDLYALPYILRYDLHDGTVRSCRAVDDTILQIS